MADAVNRKGSAYGARFAMATGLVIGAAACVLLLFAYLVTRSDSSAAWAPYVPKGAKDIQTAQKMVNAVAPRYQVNGETVASVQAQPLIYGNELVDGIALTRPTFRGIGSQYKQFEPTDKTMLYVFCGRAAACGLQAANENLAPLLQRESLELALYTFKYWPNITSVVALLPPQGQSAQQQAAPAVYLKRQDLIHQLNRPLKDTLALQKTVTPGSISEEENVMVDSLTGSRLFLSSFQKTPNGGTLLVLDPGGG
jgi:hypothetical protein